MLDPCSNIHAIAIHFRFAMDNVTQVNAYPERYFVLTRIEHALNIDHTLDRVYSTRESAQRSIVIILSVNRTAESLRDIDTIGFSLSAL